MPAYDFAVIGAGVFGSWTAWHLRRAGASVLLLDAWGPAHARASSGGESRIIRMGYGPDEIYTRMAMRSLEQWRDLFERTGEPLFHRTGVLWVGRRNEPYSEATHRTLTACGVPMEIVPASELEKRYPQLRVPGADAFGIFEPESGALLARRAVAAVVRDAEVSFTTAAIAPPSAGAVRTMSGEAIHAATFIFACGPWLPKLFPELLGTRIRPTRQEILFFAPPPGDLRFAHPSLPVWIDFTDPRRPYGFPDLESRGFKLAFDEHGPAFDPDSGDRLLHEHSLAHARRFLAERFPDLSSAPLSEFRVCQYENTPTGDFLIDRHPDWENFWIAGGGSGHGFKHGPAVGEHVASRILHGAAPEPRFSLAACAESAVRTVH